MKNLSPLACLLVLGLLVSCSEQQGDYSLAITNVTLIDALNGVRQNQTVLIQGDRIRAIVPATQEVDAAQTIDGNGGYLIPGLWDFHVHLTYDERLTGAMPALFLSWGITSVRDTGGLLENVLPVVESMRTEGAVAPRVFFAGPLLDGEFVVYDGVNRPEIGIRVATVEAARATVRELAAQGVDFIKIYEMVSPPVFEALVEAARELDLPIDSHVPLALLASQAGASVNSIEHLRNIELDCAADSDRLLEERLRRLENSEQLPGADLRSSLHNLQRLPAVRNYDQARCDRTIAALGRTTMVPTLRLNAFGHSPPFERSDWGAALQRLPADVREAWSADAAARSAAAVEGPTEFGDWSLFLSGRMHQAGLSFGAGTDTPINLSIPGYSLHSELEMLVRAGLSPLEALEAATLHPAEWFGIQDDLGSIEEGKLADLVLLDANPLENISNSRRIETVVSRGRPVEQSP